MNPALDTLRAAAALIPSQTGFHDEGGVWRSEGPNEAEYATALRQIEADLRELDEAREWQRRVAADTTVEDLRREMANREDRHAAVLAGKDAALAHYASEKNWREASLKGPLIFEYDGAYENPWDVARSALGEGIEGGNGGDEDG